VIPLILAAISVDRPLSSRTKARREEAKAFEVKIQTEKTSKKKKTENFGSRSLFKKVTKKTLLHQNQF
tara:strand:- start:3110 stop:3313 length:204 start_codon:yes stop_codon:yes gene_type:complete